MGKHSNFIEKLKGYMMPFAMIIGFVFHQQVSELSFLIPYLIFIMLLFTYIKLSWKGVVFTKMHLWLLVFQFVVSILVYAIISPFNPILAQGVLVCILAPTATSAPVIAGMLRGNVLSLTGYSLMSNLLVVLVAPIIFSYIGYHQLPFLDSATQISQKVFFLLVIPLLLSIIINRFTPKLGLFLKQKTQISFYLWSIALMIVSGRTLEFVIAQGESNLLIELILALFSLLICVVQFWFGRRIGRKYDDTVAGGQGLGQKNTILAIWMAQAYLNPISSIAPGAYVLWQNMINSWQVWRSRKKNSI